MGFHFSKVILHLGTGAGKSPFWDARKHGGQGQRRTRGGMVSHTEIGAMEGMVICPAFSSQEPRILKGENGCGHGSIFVSRLVTDGELFKGMYT